MSNHEIRLIEKLDFNNKLLEKIVTLLELMEYRLDLLEQHQEFEQTQALGNDRLL